MLVSPVGYLGGAEQVLLCIGEGLRERGIEVKFACMRPGPLAGIARSKGIETYEFRPHRYRNLLQVHSGIRWLARLAAKNNIDILHASHSAYVYVGRANRQGKIPCVWHLHDEANRKDLLLRWMLCHPPDHAIFTTPAVANSLPELAGCSSSLVPPHTIDASSIRAKKFEPKVRERFELGKGPVFLTVARFQRHKAHEVLIRSAHDLIAEHPQVRFVIVGAPADSVQEAYLNELEQTVNASRLREQIRFVGFVDEPTLLGLYREATAMVHPAVTEGYGIALLEAMALGCPVVAASAAGPASFIVQGKNGILVEPGSAESLLNGLRLVLSDGEQRQGLVENAMEWIGHHGPAEMVDKVIAVYDTLYSSPTKRTNPNLTSRNTSLELDGGS